MSHVIHGKTEIEQANIGAHFGGTHCHSDGMYTMCWFCGYCSDSEVLDAVR